MQIGLVSFTDIPYIFAEEFINQGGAWESEEVSGGIEDVPGWLLKVYCPMIMYIESA